MFVVIHNIGTSRVNSQRMGTREKNKAQKYISLRATKHKKYQL